MGKEVCLGEPSFSPEVAAHHDKNSILGDSNKKVLTQPPCCSLKLPKPCSWGCTPPELLSICPWDTVLQFLTLPRFAGALGQTFL